jgi:hypothetical protein
VTSFRCGRGEPSPGADVTSFRCGRGEPSPDADVTSFRCGRDERRIPADGESGDARFGGSKDAGQRRQHVHDGSNRSGDAEGELHMHACMCAGTSVRLAV